MENFREIIGEFLWILPAILKFLIMARIVLSWINVAKRGSENSGGLTGFIYDATEPILKPFRRIIPPIAGMFDLSPIAALFAIDFAFFGLTVLVNFIFIQSGI